MPVIMMTTVAIDECSNDDDEHVFR
jgi:hypothetical protein